MLDKETLWAHFMSSFWLNLNNGSIYFGKTPNQEHLSSLKLIPSG